MPRRSLETRIVDAVLDRAEEVGWSSVRLHDVADTLDATLAQVRSHFRDLESVADAWFKRADLAMLAKRNDAGFPSLSAKERLFAVIMCWLDAQTGHRKVVGEMLGAKLYPGHPHHNAALVFALSRTVQWIREAAHLDATGRRRQIEEIGLTALFVSVVVFWLRDESDGQMRTRQFLEHALSRADGVMARMSANLGLEKTESAPAAGGRAETPSSSKRPSGRRSRGRRSVLESRRAVS